MASTASWWNAPASACSPATASPGLYAPFGLERLYEGVLRPNPRCHQPRLFAAKAADYQARWPWLTVLETFASPA